MKLRSAALSLLALGAVLAVWIALRWSAAPSVASRELSTVDLRTEPAQTPTSPASSPSTIPVPAANAAELAQPRADSASAQTLDGEVQVIFEADRRPVPGADIYWFDSHRLDDPRCQADLDLIGMGKAFLERNGRHFQSDEFGRAHVPAPSATTQVIALTPTHFGMTTIEPRQESAAPIEVTLRPALGIDVLVRSARTREPVSGVAVVAFCNQIRDSKIGNFTDARGIAHLWPLFVDPEVHGRWYAMLPGIFREEQRVALALDEHAATAELLLPDCAPALVRIVDSGGGLCPFTGKLAIGWFDKDGDPADPAEVRISEGIADLTLVELGLTAHVRAQLVETSEEPTSVFTLEHAGPERARFDVALTARFQFLRARFVDLDGKPIAFARASCSVLIRNGEQVRVEHSTCTTHANGDASFLIAESPPIKGTLAIVFDTEAPLEEEQGGLFHGEMQERFANLGELRLAPSQRLFAGRVLDKQGHAVGGARIELSRESSSPFLGKACNSDSEGQFELRGWADPDTYTLDAEVGEFSAQVNAKLGDFAVEIRPD